MSGIETTESAVDFIRRLINAWDCCGTCAGGVLADRDRRIIAAALNTNQPTNGENQP